MAQARKACTEILGFYIHGDKDLGRTFGCPSMRGPQREDPRECSHRCLPHPAAHISPVDPPKHTSTRVADFQIMM